MTVITDEIINELTPLKTIIDLKKDQRLINDFIESTRGAGLESLDYPAGKLIDHQLASKYPDHYRLGGGTEGLVVLAAALVGGLVAYKKLIKSKKTKSIVDRTKDLKLKVEKQYGADYPDNRKQVDVAVNPTITRLFPGKDLSAITAAITKWMTDNDKAFDELVKKTKATYDDIDNQRRAYEKADESGKEKIDNDLWDKYGADPYATDFKADVPGGNGQPVTPIQISEYADARSLLIKLIDGFDRVNDEFFDGMIMGYSDDLDLGEEAYVYLKTQYDEWFDSVAGAIYVYIDELLATAKGIEDYIIKSFK